MRERCNVPNCRFAAKWEVNFENLDYACEAAVELTQQTCSLHLPMVLTEGFKCFNTEPIVTVKPLLEGVHSAA